MDVLARNIVADDVLYRNNELPSLERRATMLLHDAVEELDGLQYKPDELHRALVAA